MSDKSCFCNNTKIKIHRGKKVLYAILLLCGLLIIILFIGMIGYKYFFNMSYADAIFNTTLTATTLGIAPHEKTNTEKIFVSIYAIFCMIFFISLISAIVSYIFSLYFFE